MTTQVATSYRRVQAGTASPAQRVVMMYDGILRHLHIALEAFQGETPSRFETINNNVQQAKLIISQLQLSLDKKNGGEIASTLDQLYDFWVRHLSTANARKDPALIQEVEELVSGLRDTWATAAQEARRQGIC
ncbi:MAG: flagellar export chaperone FliS [Lentisphaerae bacterium RIFOXYB12_FULL_65_16]|nr:MAG: flagellar export chaperone FliS [Lentisphaerae bacterium RIFOXYA12_64_32]OGV92050.1 MAG: flagellar export chaperone FliS [Lentisphaerae bacterium RIFOXYB12_FULL_65_16]